MVDSAHVVELLKVRSDHGVLLIAGVMGVPGALNYLAPLQLLLGAGALLLILVALFRSCPALNGVSTTVPGAMSIPAARGP